jgi:hypothetical protein
MHFFALFGASIFCNHRNKGREKRSDNRSFEYKSKRAEHCTGLLPFCSQSWMRFRRIMKVCLCRGRMLSE